MFICTSGVQHKSSPLIWKATNSRNEDENPFLVDPTPEMFSHDMFRWDQKINVLCSQSVCPGHDFSETLPLGVMKLCKVGSTLVT